MVREDVDGYVSEVIASGQTNVGGVANLLRGRFPEFTSVEATMYVVDYLLRNAKVDSTDVSEDDSEVVSVSTSPSASPYAA